MNDRHTPPLPAANGLADLGLPAGARLGPFEVQRLIARSASSAVYLATDHALALAVAIQEYLPARLVQRDATLRLHATDEWHEDTIARGLRAFVDEARLLAHCDHPALVRVNQLFEANGTAYRVMPYYAGRRLVDVRRDMPEAPDEASLRGLLDDLLGALEAIHQGGRSHGGVTPGNIMLLGDDRPLLLGPGAAGREIGSDLVESLMATLETTLTPKTGVRHSHAPAHGALADLCALAEVTRFCITGTVPAAVDPAHPQPLAELIARSFEPARRPHYSAELLRSLDAALSPYPADWPTSAAQFRAWLTESAPPPARLREEPVFNPFGDAAPAQQPPPRTPAAATTPARRDAGLDASARSPQAALPPVVPRDEPTAVAPAEAMTADRAPWVAPVLSRRARRAGRYKFALGAGLAVLAIGVLGLVSGGWNMAPEIAVDRPLAATPPPAATVAPRDPAPPPAANPAPEAAAVPAATAASAVVAAASVPAANAVVAAASVPAATVPAPEAAAPATTPPAPAAPPVVAALDPARLIEQHPPAAAPRAAPPPAPRAPATRVAARSDGGNPRAVCSGRTEFALYRCMQQVCNAKRWQLHPQCVRLRVTDQVD